MRSLPGSRPGSQLSNLPTLPRFSAGSPAADYRLCRSRLSGNFLPPNSGRKSRGNRPPGLVRSAVNHHTGNVSNRISMPRRKKRKKPLLTPSVSRKQLVSRVSSLIAN
ncbi:hypothetical protein JOB18_036635 [Solea senegalensis]|uniref:Uncharacterized protein n=1 Tax=Solea senegalensis TaxID=28829 RepID=A0AAV6PSI1_SOLSE|nr:hypothetical protein JOB18_036635 [Solea senegalensis]